MPLAAFAPSPLYGTNDPRTIKMRGKITREVVTHTYCEIIRLQRGFCLEPITLDVASGGGDVGPTNLFFELTWNRRVSPLHGFVDSHCHSAALLVLLACERRVCSRNATFFVHTPTKKDGTPTDAEDLEKFIQYHMTGLKTQRENILRLFADGDKQHNKSISAEMALRHGFVDEIIDDQEPVELLCGRRHAW